MPEDGVAIPLDVARQFNVQFAALAGNVETGSMIDEFILPVLVVHDDNNTAQRAQGILTEAGIDSCIASSADEAVVRLTEQEFAAVLLQDQLSGDGSRVVMTAAKSRSRPIPVILVAAGGAEFSPDLLNRGGDDYVRDTAAFLEQLASRIEHVVRVAAKEQELKRARQLFGMIADAASEVLTVADGMGKIAYVSAGSSRLLGYEPQELVGTVALELVHPEDRPRMVLARQTPGDEQLVTTYRCRRKDGAYIWLEVRAKIARHPETGAVVEVLGLSRDISDRVRLINQLQIVSDATANGIFLIDPNGQTTMVNAEVERLFGYPRGELLGVPIKEVVRSLFRSDSGRQSPDEPVQVGDAGGELIELETLGQKRTWIGVHRNGRAIPLAVVQRRIRTAEGTYSLLTIADRIGAAERLRAASATGRRQRAYARRRRAVARAAGR